MVWETPTFVEIRMDAEFTAYMDDVAGDKADADVDKAESQGE